MVFFNASTFMHPCIKTSFVLAHVVTTGIRPSLSNLGDNKSLIIDGVKPTITSITSTTGNGPHGIGSDIAVNTTFSEAVTLSGGDYVVTLETGLTDGTVTISSISNSTTANGTYTVDSTQATSDLSASAATTGTISDAAGNAMTSFAIGTNIDAASEIVVETTLPLISNITSSTTNGTYGVDDGVNVTVTFSESVTMTAGGVFKVPLETGSTNADYELEIASISGTTGSGTYTVRANDDTVMVTQ